VEPVSSDGNEVVLRVVVSWYNGYKENEAKQLVPFERTLELKENLFAIR
jgi:hypothetical protein